MSITLQHHTNKLLGKIQLTTSKSESSRALIIQALCDSELIIENLSAAEDTIVLKELLQATQQTLDVGLSGTAMRFLTAYFAIQKGRTVVLSGAERMKKRPIGALVDALKQLGADISYLENEGYPPLQINGKGLTGGAITIDTSVSSQFISALLLLVPKLSSDLTLNLKGELISKPYIDLTIAMLQQVGVEVEWRGSSILVNAKKYVAIPFKIGADWSAASYWYSMVALAKEADITLIGLQQKSLQGDAMVQKLYEKFGVSTTTVEEGIRLTKTLGFNQPVDAAALHFDFLNCPDLAQTVAVTCAALNVDARLTGLQTLRIKETDRIFAIQEELNKLGFDVHVENDELIINALPFKNNLIKPKRTIKTYNDHRMAMAFAPLVFLGDLTIEDAKVVKKSYPRFWEDLQQVGILVN